MSSNVPRETIKMFTTPYDVIVVGAGLEESALKKNSRYVLFNTDVKMKNKIHFIINSRSEKALSNA